VIVNVAAELTAAEAARAILLLEESRPAGVRLLHNIDAPPPFVAGVPPNVHEDPLTGPPSATVVEPLYQPVRVRALLLPAQPTLSGSERASLQGLARAAIHALVADAGIGETLVYNRLIAALMASDGVLDVALELYPKPALGATEGARYQNLSPKKILRPRLAEEDLTVEIASEIVAFDITVTIALTDFAKETGDPADTLAAARVEVSGLLQDRIGSVPAPIDATALLAQVPATLSYAVTTLSYTVQYIEAGLQVNVADPPVTLGALERPWVRTVRTTAASG
jgi:hypothetical protein